MSSAEEKLERFRRARLILTQSAPPQAVWFLAGDVPCNIYKGSMGPMIFEDDRVLNLVCEFLRETAPVFDEYLDASLALLGTETMRVKK